MLGQSLSDPAGVEYGGDMSGIGLLPHSTVFEDQKVRTAATGILSEVDGIFADLSGKEYQGYEIHMGVSGTDNNIINEGNVYGTYIHGVFDKEEIAKTIVTALLAAKGLDFSDVKAFDIEAHKQTQYDILAEGLRKSLDMELLRKIVHLEV